MAKMRIYEIAKSLNMKSTDLVKMLNDNGFAAKSPQSNVEDAAIAFVLRKFSPKKEIPKEEMPEKEVKTGASEEHTIPAVKQASLAEPPAQSQTKEEPKENQSKPADTKEPGEGSRTKDMKNPGEGGTNTTDTKRTEEIKTVEKQAAESKTAESKTTENKPAENRPTENKTAENKTAENRTTEHKPAENSPAENRPMENRKPGEYNRPAGDGNRPGYQGNRPDGRPSGDGTRTGYQGNRPSGDGTRPGYQGNRPVGDGTRPGYQGNRPVGDGARPGYQGNRPDGRPGYQGNRPDGRPGYQGNRPAGDGARPGYQGNRPVGDGARPGYQGNRPDGRPGYQGNRPDGRPGYQGNRPAGDGARPGYQGNRPDGRPGYQGNSPDGRPGYQGNRPAGDGARPGYQGNRPDGRPGGYSNNRPGEGTRPGGYNNTRPQDGNRPGGYGNSRPGGYNSGTGAPRRPGDNQRPGQPGGRSYGGFDKGGQFEKDTQPMPTKTTKVKSKTKNKERDREKEHRRDEMPKKDPNRKGAFIKPKPIVKVYEPVDSIKNIILSEIMTIKELADKMKIQPSALVKKLFLQGKMVSLNHEILFEEAEELALEYNCIAELEEKVDVIEELLKEDEEEETTMTKRPPVVCVMGHVDHGKTSLLDAIRKTRVTEKEAGGITQHIGAYVVKVKDETITFLDTPGHEAFTSMRMRGAKSTDIAILVVAADDGVMPQTVEAISHAKAAGVEILVAINKIDKPGANLERVKQELVEHELIAEDWGGSTVFVPVSAKTGEGIDQLLEMITLTAEVMELKSNAERKARGIVIEAQLDKGRGPVATILVQKGTLNVGDSIAIGSSYGKVRAMMDDKGRRVKEATPSTPVEILGLNEVPDAGEVFMATENDKEARSIASAYIKQGREKLLDDTKAKLSLDGLFSQIKAGNIKELNIIVKADVQGSVEAVKQSLLKLSNEEVAIRIIHGGVGAVNESDVSLASASNAIIIGFNVRPDNTAKEMAEREKVDLRLYKVIYNAIEDIEAAMKGMLDPIFEEKVIGHVEVRQIFKASGLGIIAGSYVMDGKITRNSSVRITREGKLIHEGALASLKRFKDDVKEVTTGYECGLVFEKYDDINEFDQIEAYIMEEVPR